MSELIENDREELERILFNIGSAESVSTPGFTIDSPDKAAWAARKIVQAETRIAQQSRMAEEYRKRIESWYESTIKSDLASIDYLKGLLKPYTIEAVREMRKGKTLRFPGIAISLRKLPDRLEIVDEQLALRYCEKHVEAAVETKKTLIRSELRKVLTNGAIIPGADIVPGGEELYVSDETDQMKEGTKHVAA